MVTGDGNEAEDAGEPPSAFAQLDRPVVALVADTTISLSEFSKLSEVVFKNEKIGIGMKAFRAVRIAPSHADADPLLAGKGNAVPRLVVVDPVKERVKVLEKGALKVSSLYAEMKRVADRFYKEKFEKCVKRQLKLLNRYDKLDGEVGTLQAKLSRLRDDSGAKARKERAEVEAEIEAAQAALDEVQAEGLELWKLTPRDRS